jgi:hypothetical protein
VSAADALILPFVTRMIVPLRREFGRELDVHRFMADAAYAQAVLERARGSADQRLRDYAEYVGRHLGGARETDAPRVELGQPGFEATAPGVARLDDEAADAEALRQRILKKYQGGIR